ncbi:PLP-dependent aminotransferase family protein [Amycolatopsis plumensis]|uniref:PLP-dependent aminotransferase family protein n=1 Tax=Amycolatopsis plumensis TaxID=236508 RepID=A0ABV5UIS7_9PSEU
MLDLPGWGSRRRALEEALRSAVRDGRLPAGMRLPSSRDLAAQLGVSRGTVTAAYEQLIAEGWLASRQGSATRVADGTMARSAAGFRVHAWPGEPEHDLRPGRPDPRAFPRELWARAVRHTLREAPEEAFGFGDPRGRIELRTTLAACLGRARGIRIDPAQLVICSGYTQALGLLGETFAEVGVRTAGMEDPAVPDHVRQLDTHVNVVDVPLDDDGLRVDVLDAVDAEVAVCTPTHQFPLGTHMSARRRHELLAWADRNLGWIVEDDYDGEFRYDRQPIAALQSRRPGRVIYVGSTSKTLGPAVRLGWIACPAPLLESLVEAKRRARPTSPLDQLALARMIEVGDYDRHLRKVRRGYRERRDVLVEAMRSRLTGTEVRGIEAGLHALVQLPPGVAEDTARVALRKASVGVHTLSSYLRSDDGRHAASLVVGYAAPPAHAYAAAIDALVRVVGGLPRQ